MPCAAGDLCQLPNEELIAPNGHECGHECRGGCGGRLHGLCGEVEDGSDTPTHRICHTCISKRSPSNSAKRKEGQGFLQPDARKKKKTQESGSGKRLTERMAGIVAEEIDPSDDEKELNESGDAESGGGRKVEAPPPYSDLSSCFGPLEQKAESAGNSEAAHFLRKAKMAFLAAHAAKPTQQADIRMFSES